MTVEIAAAIAAWLSSRSAATDHSQGRQGLLPKRRVPQFSPPLRGGVDATSTKYRKASLYGADGVGIKFHRILLRLNTTPSARAKDASRRFYDRAATPPRRGGENSRLHDLGNRPVSPPCGSNRMRFARHLGQQRV
jgi:hypothetical protein